MKSQYKIPRIIAIILLFSFLTAGSACKSNKIGCPNQITQAERDAAQRV